MFFALAICLLAAESAHAIQCKDEYGNNVDCANVPNTGFPACCALRAQSHDTPTEVHDYPSPCKFYIYKLPKISGHKNPLLRQGLGHIYLASKNPQSDWTLAERSVNDTKSMLGRTFAPLYNKTTTFDLFHVMYNDDPPTINSTAKYGHTKGVLFGDRNSSVWIMHSVPRFPNPPLKKNSTAKMNKTAKAGFGKLALNSYEFPESGTKFGQVLLCLSLPWNAEMNDITSQLFLRTLPRMYSTRLPNFQPSATTSNEGGRKKQKTKHILVDDPSQLYVATVSTIGNKKFTIYGKSRNWLVDIYSRVVAPDFEDSFFTETWRNGGGDPMEPFCEGQYHVNNIQKLNVSLSAGNVVSFKNSQDHSKWAISMNTTRTVCVGDLNRMETQKKRGGGVICTEDKNVWKRFQQIIQDTDIC